MADDEAEMYDKPADKKPMLHSQKSIIVSKVDGEKDEKVGSIF